MKVPESYCDSEGLYWKNSSHFLNVGGPEKVFAKEKRILITKNCLNVLNHSR